MYAMLHSKCTALQSYRIPQIVALSPDRHSSVAEERPLIRWASVTLLPWLYQCPIKSTVYRVISFIAVRRNCLLQSGNQQAVALW